MIASQPQTLQMSAVETGRMSSIETGQMSAVGTGQMSAVETRQCKVALSNLHGGVYFVSWLFTLRWRGTM